MESIATHPLFLSVLIAMPLFGGVAKLFGARFMTIAKWYLYIAVFAIIVVMNSTFFPFIGGKDYFFRYAVQLALIAVILSWAFEARQGEIGAILKANAKKPLFIAVSAFVFAVLLSCAFAYDSHAAFWSNYERGEGGFQMIHYYVFFVLLTFILREDEDWKNIFRFSLVAAGLMILYGIAGNFGANGFIGPYATIQAPDGWWHRLVDGRFQGSLGNPAYVAPYLIFSMFYAAYLWSKRKKSNIDGIWVVAGYVLMIATFFFFLILSQTRGALLGLGVGILALIAYLMVEGRGSLRKWSGLALAVIILLGGVAFAIKDLPAVQRIPAARLLQISVSDSTAQTRFWVWGEAWKGFLERPVFGWGPENFTAVHDKFFDPRFFVPGVPTETWFDRAHSIFFDYLAETGIVGLLAYLSIFALLAYEFFFKRRKAEEYSPAGTLQHALMFALPVAYLVQGVAIFDVLPMYLNLFLFFAFMFHYLYRTGNQNAYHGQHR